MAGLFYEQFEVGQVFRHAVRRTVTDTDNIWFTTLTCNPAAIHIDADYCQKHTEFGQPIVNSAFTLGLVIGLSVGETTLGTTVGNLGMDEVKFPNPVFAGDTIRSETEVISKRESQSRPGQGIVVLQHRGYNQKGDLICTVKRPALMLKGPTE